jgi:hypothetical protein
VLQDYVQHGLEDDQGKRSLLFRREVETAIYNTLPSNLNNQLRRHPVRCPVAFIGGRSSVEMRQVGMEMTQRITRGRITMLDGGHLFHGAARGHRRRHRGFAAQYGADHSAEIRWQHSNK